MKGSTYKVIRKVHLYASLSIVGLLLMYVVSSYLMIHYEKFKTYQRQESTQSIKVDDSSEISEANWSEFLSKNGVSGKLTNETTAPDGSLVRRYFRAGQETEIKINPEGLVEISTSKANLAGHIVGLHRIRGFDGPFPYLVYAILLDLVGISLVLFAITGAILWLKLLKNDPWAWVVFIAGFIYVAAIVGYLMVE